MTTTRTQDEIKAAVAKKLHPNRLRVSPMFTAILACLVGESWTQPAILELCVLDDGILAREEGHLGFDRFLAAPSDLWRNLRGVADAAELDEEETAWLVAQAEACKR